MQTYATLQKKNVSYRRASAQLFTTGLESHFLIGERLERAPIMLNSSMKELRQKKVCELRNFESEEDSLNFAP